MSKAALGMVFMVTLALAVTAACGVWKGGSDGSPGASAPVPEYPLGTPIVVTPDNFVRAATDAVSARVVQLGGIGKFFHSRELTPIDRQTVIRPNRDTLYSTAVFDLDAGPVTITLPDAGSRYISLQALTEDEYTTEVGYAPGRYTLDRATIGTRYAVVGVRIFVDPNKPGDLDAVHALQDAISVEQARPGSFAVPQWDPPSLQAVSRALTALGATMPETTHAFGSRDGVDPIQHLVGAETAWGDLPARDATYLTVIPPQNTGAVDYSLQVPKDVPVDAFWSVTVYNADGYLQANPLDAYSFNNYTAQTGPDGSVDIRFGGCSNGTVNCLPIFPGWNYQVRLYRPRQSILNGQWTFPAPQPVH